MGAELGFEVLGVGLEAAARRHDLLVDRASASCSREGDVAAPPRSSGAATSCGAVVEGDRRGRELGFPTANVRRCPDCCLPADGIYAGTFWRADGVERTAAISLGRRPTFYEHAEMSLLEAYVLDFDGDLYGQAGAGAVRRAGSGARSASRSVEALVAQIAQRRRGHPAGRSRRPIVW